MGLLRRHLFSKGATRDLQPSPLTTSYHTAPSGLYLNLLISVICFMSRTTDAADRPFPAGDGGKGAPGWEGIFQGSTVAQHAMLHHAMPCHIMLHRCTFSLHGQLGNRRAVEAAEESSSDDANGKCGHTSLKQLVPAAFKQFLNMHNSVMSG